MHINPHDYGRVGAVHAPPHRRVLSQRFPAGPFGAVLRPALCANQRGAYSACLTLGMLTIWPDLDGYGSLELEDGLYRRVAVALVDHTRTQHAVPSRVVFNVSDGSVVTGLGLFNGQGELEAFGALRAYTTAETPPDKFELPAFQLVVKRVQTSLTSSG